MTCCRKICHRPCAHNCKKAFPKGKTISKIHEECIRNDNFILIGAKYILDFYHCTRRSILTDDFFRSVVTSITLFAIGVQLTRTVHSLKLPLILGGQS